MDRFTEMTEGPLKKLICRMAGPSMASMLVTAVYNMADTYFVGFIGTSATGAVGVVFSLMAVIMATGLFFGHGSGNAISRALGEQREEVASHMLATGFFCSFGMGALIAGAGLLFLEPLARFLGATETILPHACGYMRYILLGTPFMAASLTLNNQLRFQGSPKNGMLGIVSGALINIALDPIFIFALKMGTAGAGLATMLSQMFSFSLLLYGCTRAGNLRIRPKAFAVTRAAAWEMLRSGFPSMARQLLSAAATIALNRAARGYGDAAIAAMAIVSRLMSFANSAVLGFGQGFQPVCGFNYGAGRYDRVLAGYRFCQRTALTALLVAAGAGLAFAGPLVAVFRDDPAVLAVGVRALRLQCATFPLVGFVIMANMLFQNIGAALPASLLSIARQGLFFLPALLLLAPLLGILGLQLSQPIADICTFCLALPMSLRACKRLGEMGGDNAGKGLGNKCGS